MTGKFATKLGISLVGAAGSAACVTMLSLAMRSVLDLGGFCASGGPYDIAVQCPQSLGWLMPVAIVGGLILVGVFIGFMPFEVDGLGLFAWSALFLALGWNFLDYGIGWHGHSWQAGFLVPGILFVLMGGIPLWFSLTEIGGAVIKGPAPEPAPKPTPAVNPYPSYMGAMPVMPTFPVASVPPTTSAKSGDLATELERLAALHRSGDLTDSQYETAKSKLIEGGQ